MEINFLLDIQKEAVLSQPLSQKVQEDLINDVRAKNENVNEQEILYLASKAYDELLVAQVNSLDIEFF